MTNFSASFHELRRRFASEQRDVLSAIWRYFLDNHRWIPQRVLHHQFQDVGKSEIRNILQTYGGSIVFECREEGKQVYRLTLLGVLLTDQRRTTEGLLVSYVEYVRQRYLANPETERITSSEIESQLGLDKETSRRLRELVDVAGLGIAGWSSDGTWQAHMPSDVDEWSRDGGLLGTIHEIALGNYKPSMPIDEAGRMRATFSDPAPDEQASALPKDESTRHVGDAETVYGLQSLHQEIRAKCLTLFIAGQYAEAVEKSFKVVRDRLRAITGYETGSEAFGKGRLHIKGAVAAHVERDFNEGVKFLTMAIDRFRNEKSHTSDARIDDPVRAYEYLRLSSLAMNLLDAGSAGVSP